MVARILERWEAGERFGLTGAELTHFEGAGNPLQHKDLAGRLVDDLTGGDDDDGE